MLLKRRLHYYVKSGDLYHIRRGIYARDKDYDKFEFAAKLLTPAYISFETILVPAGIVFQYYKTIFVASYQSREIECDGQNYKYRHIKDIILLNKAGLEDRGSYFAASKERAFLDIIYLDTDYYFDNLAPLDFDKVYELLPIYFNKRMVRSVDKYFKHYKEEL